MEPFAKKRKTDLEFMVESFRRDFDPTSLSWRIDWLPGTSFLSQVFYGQRSSFRLSVLLHPSADKVFFS